MNRKPFLEVKHVTKSFYGVKALKDIDLSIFPGEVLGLIGENGAGKSTLMKIVSGAYSFEEGEAFIDGDKVEITSPMMMNELGVSMVYQDTKLIPELKVYQNIYLHNEIVRCGLTDDRKMCEESEKLLKKVEIDVNVNSYVKHLTIAQKQSVEIAKALSRNIKMLILDEPTSSLTPNEVERLFNTVREIKRNGVAVVFISHRISELLEICDRFAVLRDGYKVGEVDRADATEQRLAQMMVGRDIKKERSYVEDPTAGEILLRVRNLSNKKNYTDISFDLHKGEILGFYGIEGNGQRELLRSICGLNSDYQGEVMLNGKALTLKTSRHALDAGITFITNERHRENVFLPLSIIKNLTISNLKQWTKFGVFVNETKQKSEVASSIEQFAIKCMGEKQALQELSGGNQQKVSIAGRFLQGPKVFIFDESTFGVDIGAKSDIYKFIHALVEQGIGVIMLSSDMTEIITVCDRILVMGGGRIQDEMHGNDATENRIIESAVKGHDFKKSEASKEEIKTSRHPTRYMRLLNEKWFSVYTVISVLIIMMIIGRYKNPIYVSQYNLGLIMWQSVPIMLIAIAQGFVLLAGHIDLSIGQLMGLSTCIVSYMLANNSQLGTGFLALIAAGVSIGLLNALIVVGMGVPHFIATLSTQIIVLGIALLIRNVPGGSVAPILYNSIRYKIDENWPISFFVMILVVVAAEIFLQKTKAGIYIRATGSFREAAFYSGINTNRVRVLVYVGSGIITALAGLVLAVRIGAGDPNSGSALSFQSVTSVVIGGISLSGGRGSILGGALGAILLVSMLNFLNMMQISTYWQYICMGVMIFLSVAFFLYADYRQSKKL
jgi:ribose transport system ATP-binding protein